MATFNTITTDDLVSYALWLAGEPVDGNSDYNDRILQHMQTVYNTFLNGGTLGTRDVATSAGLYSQLINIPTTDWLWFRKFPPYAFVTTPAILGVDAGVTLNQGSLIGTVQLTYGDPTITFSIAPSVSVEGWRLKLLNQMQGVPNPPMTVPRIADHTAAALTAELDTPWNQESQTVSQFVLFQAEYELPDDFVRFVEPPQVQGGSPWYGADPGKLCVGSYEQVNRLYPLTEYNQGPPTAAARLTPEIFMVNRWDTLSYRSEFSYIFTPPTLEVEQTPAQEPLIPVRFRHVLSIGAAMLAMMDKVDARTHALASEFREIIAHMGIEYRKEQNAGSDLSCRHLTRQGSGRRGMLRTSSGLPLW